jgi:hypothetical protein
MARIVEMDCTPPNQSEIRIRLGWKRKRIILRGKISDLYY